MAQFSSAHLSERVAVPGNDGTAVTAKFKVSFVNKAPVGEDIPQTDGTFDNYDVSLFTSDINLCTASGGTRTHGLDFQAKFLDSQLTIMQKGKYTLIYHVFILYPIQRCIYISALINNIDSSLSQ